MPSRRRDRPTTRSMPRRWDSTSSPCTKRRPPGKCRSPGANKELLMATTTSPDQPNWVSSASQEMRDAAKRCRDIREATPKLRKEKTTYLPRFQAESLKDWEARVGMTVVLDFFEQAVTTLVGLGLRHDPKLGEKVPE